jgi:phosphopantetheinyl transferase
MSFKTHHLVSNLSDIHLLEYSDFDPSLFLDRLTSIEKERLYSFKSKKRKREFVATRILRHEIFGFEHIHYNAHGAPYIESEGFISISHCDNMVGLAINKDHIVGFDLESPRDNILELKHKFLSDFELNHFDSNNTRTVTQLWSAKEALYKLAGRKGILFIEELHLSKAGANQLNGTIINDDHKLSTKLDIFDSHGNIITINATPVERIDL